MKTTQVQIGSRHRDQNTLVALPLGLFEDMSLVENSSRDFEKIRRLVLMKLKEREIRQILKSVAVMGGPKASLFGRLDVEGREVCS
jgi:hypothetical protein